MGGTRGSGAVFSADIVLKMSGVRRVRGVVGVCEMGMCLARVGWEVWGELVRGLGLGFNIPV